MNITITIVIIAITCIISFSAFQNQRIIHALIFYPPAITNNKQWYRFITCGFIHADVAHLFFNMFAFYVFGTNIEKAFESDIYGSTGRLMFLVLYISALFACLLPTYFQHKNNYAYRSLGASGAVSAIVFAYILINPLMGIGLMFLPFSIPGFIFGPIYLIISSVLAKRGNSHINHSAHFWGAMYGIAFLIVTSVLLANNNPISNFIYQVKSYFAS